MKIRLDKYLADMGMGSRSELREKIKKGLAQVDQKIVKSPQEKVDPDCQKVCLEGIPVRYVAFEYIMMNKPEGVVSATRDAKQKTVLDLLSMQKRRDIFPVGRLDKDTEGLLLLSNDGNLAHRLLSPSSHVDKIYFARIQGIVDEEEKKIFAEGIDIGDAKLCLPAKLELLRILEESIQSEVEITIQEGRFHQIKRMFHALGKEVLYLQRMQMGELRLDPALKPGEHRHLTEEEIKCLC